MSQLQSEDVESRKQAAIGLQEQGPKAKKAIPALVKALNDNNAEVRLRAVEALGAIGEPNNEAVIALASSLSDEDVTVRRATLDAFGRLSLFPTSAFAAIIRRFADEDSLVCRMAMTTFEELGSQGTGSLIKALQDPSPAIRRASALVLGRIGEVSPRIIDALKKASLDQDEDVAQTASYTLKRIMRE
jgi:HEAT repeat protein